MPLKAGSSDDDVWGREGLADAYGGSIPPTGTSVWFGGESERPWSLVSFPHLLHVEKRCWCKVGKFARVPALVCCPPVPQGREHVAERACVKARSIERL